MNQLERSIVVVILALAWLCSHGAVVLADETARPVKRARPPKWTADVLDALWDHTDLDPAELRYVEVRTADGIVELHGNTVSERGKAIIEDVARQVPGVFGVRNCLLSFEKLAEEVHLRLHQKEDDPTSGAGSR